jgi:hypothetical protein
MHDIDETKTKKLVRQFLTISPGSELRVLSSTFYSDTESRLYNIARRTISKEEPPVVLWNAQPWKAFNLLHAIYCQKLKDFIDVGLNCVIILYDKLVEKKIRILPQERPEFEKNVRNCFAQLKRAGLTERTEFLRESDLWEMIDFKEFAEKITTFAHLCDFDKTWAEKEDVVSFIIDNLCEIYYESLINCDILLTGDIDVQHIWGMLRSKILDKNLLPNYTPPLVLYYPTLMGIDGKPLSPHRDDNSLSIRHDDQLIEERLMGCSQEFLETTFTFLSFHIKKK